MNIGGYMGKILRVDLSKGETSIVELDQSTIEKWVGGAGFGAKFLYDEVPSGIAWSDPNNSMVWTMRFQRAAESMGQGRSTSLPRAL